MQLAYEFGQVMGPHPPRQGLVQRLCGQGQRMRLFFEILETQRNASGEPRRASDSEKNRLAGSG
jgi:hypothetical protein